MQFPKDGGYGFIEEYPCAQYARDVKIFSIWEGTNYIQALDLCARKMTMNKGKTMMTFMKEIGTFIEMNKATPGFEVEFKILAEAFGDYQGILGAFNGYMQAGKVNVLGLFATRILHATAMVYCGRLLLDQAILADKKLKELGDDHFDATYYKGKIASARFYVKNIVPQVGNTKKIIEIGDTTASDLAEDCLR